MNNELQEAITQSRLALLIPRFPTQTHIAMWRLGQAMRQLGLHVQLVSTTRPDAAETCHESLMREAAHTFYVWPPNPGAAAARAIAHPLGLVRCLSYVAGLRESSMRERFRALGLIISAANLAAFCRREKLDHLLVHSCADAAHVAAMCRLLGGPAYALRLGGDLKVYGRDHASKMRDATLIVAAAAVNQREVMDRVGLPAARLMWTPLGVDTSRFTPAPPRESPAGTLELVSVSRLNEKKGLLDVLEAVRRAADDGVSIRYRVGGAGPHEATIRQRITDLGLEKQVEMLGSLDETRVIETLRSSDAFVLASTGAGEASPVAVIEAMACGLPVVCTRIGGTADMVTDGVEGLLVDQHDVAGLTTAFESLARQPALRQRLGAAARCRAQEQFDCRRVAQKVLERMIGRPTGRTLATASIAATAESHEAPSW